MSIVAFKDNKKKSIIIFILMTVFIITVLGYILRYTYYNGLDTNVYQESEPRNYRQVESYELIENELNVSPQRINGIVLRFKFKEAPLRGDSVIVSLFNAKTGELVGAAESSTSMFIDDAKKKFLFPNVIEHKGEPLRLNVQFSRVDFEDGLFIQTVGDEGSNILDVGTISLGVDNYLIYVAIIGGLFLILATSFFYIFFIKKGKPKMEYAYLYTGIILGIIFNLLIPVMEVPDEPVHAFSAYSLSNDMLGVEKNPDGSLYMRADDSNWEFQIYKVKRPYLDDYYSRIFSKVKDKTIVTSQCVPGTDTNRYLYFLPSLGITLGRLLGLGTVPMYILGRLFNLCAFICAVFFGIKFIPFGKHLVFIWAILPSVIQQAMSFSRDSMVLSLSIFIISMTMHIMYHKEAETNKMKKLAALLVCVLFLLPSKGFAHILIAVFPLMIIAPKGIKLVNERVVSRFKYAWAVIIGVIILSGSLIAAKLLSILNYIGYTNSALIKLFVNTLWIQTDNYIFSALGNHLGWMDISFPKYVVLPFLFLLILTAIRERGEKYMISVPVKLSMLIAFFGSCFIVFIGMLMTWTTPAYNFIDGVQGRHFLPGLVFLFFPLYSRQIVLARGFHTKAVMAAVFLHMFIIVGIVINQVLLW